MATEGPLLFDTHVHLDWLSPGDGLEAELDAARRAGVGGFLVPGVDRERWPALLRLGRETDRVWTAPGLHPLAAGAWDDAARRELENHLGESAVVAVGEIGLDRLLDAPSQALQEQAFRGQLRLAVAAGLPVLIHCRRAIDRLLEILAEEGAGRVGGILHAFSGSLESARRGIDLGFAIGFGGPLTYPNARRPLEVLRGIPRESIVLETDAPDLPPHPYRGEENRPEWLHLVARKVAEIRGWSLEETARVTTANARRILNIGDA